MELSFFGVRGSYPSPGKDTVKYGGNTTCVTFTNEHEGKIDRLVIDCGTGAIPLGREIIKNHLPQEVAKLDAVLPAITLSVICLIVVSLLTKSKNSTGKDS